MFFMKGEVSIAKIVGSVIAIVVAVSMIKPINDALSDANLSGTQKTLGDLVPIVFVAGVILISVYAFMKR